MRLNQYYKEIYLPLHKHPLTKLLHFLGQLFSYTILAMIIAATVNGFWIALLGLPIAWCAVYPFAWYAHMQIEKNTPAAFTAPVWAKLSDIRMFFEVLTGQLPLDTRDEASKGN